MHQIIEWISTFASDLVDRWGLFGVFVGMVLESACIPIPSEVIMLTGGFFASKGTFSFTGVAAAGVAGNLVGSILIYWIGLSGGRALLIRFGKYVLIRPHHVKKAEAWFGRYGERAAFFGRILPVIRTFISLPAGIGKMNFPKFCLYTLLGCIVWNVALTYLGFQLHENWKTVETYLRPVSYLMLAGLVAYLLFLFIKIKRGQSSTE